MRNKQILETMFGPRVDFDFLVLVDAFVSCKNNRHKT